VVLLTDIYPAREQPIPGVSSDLVERAVEHAGTDVAWSGPRSQLATALAARVRPGDIVLTVGAGDITATGPELLALLRERGA
jgi:UDP-N-acetylmuramate--alanine ligase